MSEPELISMHVQRTAEAPFAAYKRQQAALARRRLYPLSAFYTLYAILVLAIAFSTNHPWIAVAFFTAGCATWTVVEYLFHRYVLHGRFPPGKGLIRKFLHERLDPLHWDHHARPFDGSHISGGLKDILPLFFCRSSRQLSVSRLYKTKWPNFDERVSKVEGTSMYSRLGLLASLVILLSMLALRAIYSKVKISRRWNRSMGEP
jgi:hypothetical protein